MPFLQKPELQGAAALHRLRMAFEAEAEGLRANARERVLENASPGTGFGTLIDFASNDYLGLRTDPRLAEGGAAAARLFGSGSGASRLVRAADGAAFALETSVAQLGGFEKAVLLGSGFTANLALLESLSAFSGEDQNAQKSELFLDARAHASLHIGARLSGPPIRYFRHRDYVQLESRLRMSTALHRFIVVESLHSMDGDFEDLPALCELAGRTGSLLVVDEAHTFGIAGPQGLGCVSALTPAQRIHIVAVMLGCGKALGVGGGFVCGPSWFIHGMLQKARAFLYTTAPSPFVAGALAASLGIVASAEGGERRTQLAHRTDHMHACMDEVGLKFRSDPGSPIIGVECGEDEAAVAMAERARGKGFYVRAIRPPTVPRGTSRVRLVCHATHTLSQIGDVCRALTSPV